MVQLRPNDSCCINNLDSSNKCNKMVKEDLVGCTEAETLARTVIKTVVDELNIIVGV